MRRSDLVATALCSGTETKTFYRAITKDADKVSSSSEEILPVRTRTSE